jgi:hypothetical protein
MFKLVVIIIIPNFINQGKSMAVITKTSLAALIVGCSTLLSAAVIDLSTLQMNGTAAMSGSDLRLTDNVGGQAGSAYIATPVPLTAQTSFSTQFELYIHGNGGGGADGMTFVIQNNSDTALGLAGGSLAYGGVLNSIAVEFDTWVNGTDPNDNHIGIDTNGSISSLSTYIVPWSLDDDINHIFGWVEYDAASHVLDVYVNNNATKPALPQLSESIDLLAEVGGGQAYFGFTGATGGVSDIHDVLSWDLNVTTPQAVPTVSTTGKTALAVMMALGTLLFFRKRNTKKTA